MRRSTVARADAAPRADAARGTGDDPRPVRRWPPAWRLPAAVRQVAAGAGLLLALGAPAAAQLAGTVQYQFVEITIADFPDTMYADWFIGAASGRASAGFAAISIQVPSGTPVGTVATALLRTLTARESLCHLEIAMPTPQTCEPRLVTGPRCILTSTGVQSGLCRMSVVYQP